MKKVIRNDSKIDYILMEQERVSLVGDEVKQLLQNKLNNIEKYSECKIDFFTDKEVDQDNKWYFNVEKNGEMYTCIYDSFEDYSNKEEELRLLMWRYSDEKDGNISYIEVVGNYIDEKGNVYTVNDTYYNDCNDYNFTEEIELNDSNKEEVYRRLIQ